MSAGTQEGREDAQREAVARELASNFHAATSMRATGEACDAYAEAHWRKHLHAADRMIALFAPALTKAEQELAKATLERDEAVKRAEKAGNTAVNLNELLIASEARAAAMEGVLSPAWFRKMRTYLAIFRGDKELREMIRAAGAATGITPEPEHVPPLRTLTSTERRTLAEIADSPERHALTPGSPHTPQPILVLMNLGLIDMSEPDFVPSITDLGKAALAQPGTGGAHG